MSEMSGRPARVGVRELRQNLSVYLRRVKAGETLEVTEHGHVVAELGPVTEPSRSRYERMIADGRIVKATRRWEDLPPPMPSDAAGPTASEILQQMRDEERW